MSLFSIKTEVRGQGRGFIHRYEVKRAARKHRRMTDKDLIQEYCGFYPVELEDTQV